MSASKITTGWCVRLAPKTGGTTISLPLNEADAEAILAKLPQIAQVRERDGEALEPAFSIYLDRS